ncbi:MAG: helix-turn-helix domain-containing protein [Tolypothrix sp. T3-bin4]|nr:helix-turn-helix domain-containing protein [Tolypothrix sp. T3-bin4]
MQPNLMSEPIALQAYLSVDELERRYRQAKVPAERTQFQIIWLVAQGKSTEEAASITGYNPQWVYQLICRYNQQGSEEFIDKRHKNPVLFLIHLLTQVNASSTINEDFVQEGFFAELRVNSTYLTLL